MTEAGPSHSETAILDLRSEPQHLAALAEWHQEEWAHLNPGETLPMRIERMQEYLGEPLVPSMFICRCDGALAGSAAVVACDMDTRPGPTPWLASVFVAPEFRRRGIGAALVRHTMAETSRAGFSKMYLYTLDQERLYQAIGWTTLSCEVYKGVDVVVMEAELGP